LIAQSELILVPLFQFQFLAHLNTGRLPFVGSGESTGTCKSI